MVCKGHQGYTSCFRSGLPMDNPTLLIGHQTGHPLKALGRYLGLPYPRAPQEAQWGPTRVVALSPGRVGGTEPQKEGSMHHHTAMWSLTPSCGRFQKSIVIDEEHQLIILVGCDFLQHSGNPSALDYLSLTAWLNAPWPQHSWMSTEAFISDGACPDRMGGQKDRIC